MQVGFVRNFSFGTLEHFLFSFQPFIFNPGFWLALNSSNKLSMESHFWRVKFHKSKEKALDLR